MTDYHDTLATECVPIGDAVNPNVACVTTFMCHDDEQEALRRGLEGANFFGYSLAHYYVFGRHQPGRTDVWAEYQRPARRARATRPRRSRRPRATATASARRSCEEGGFFGLRGAIGTPDQIRDYLRRYEECGVDQVILCSQAGKNRHEHIMESLELFGTRGAARVHGARRAARSATRRRGSRPAIDAAHGPQARVRPPAAAVRRLRVPGDPAGPRRPGRGRRLPPVARRLRRADRARWRGRARRPARLRPLPEFDHSQRSLSGTLRGNVAAHHLLFPPPVIRRDPRDRTGVGPGSAAAGLRHRVGGAPRAGAPPWQ